ncbi:hypothetical protein [Nostoc sp.]
MTSWVVMAEITHLRAVCVMIALMAKMAFILKERAIADDRVCSDDSS